MQYSYVHRYEWGEKRRVTVTSKEEWLRAILNGDSRPKAPKSWMRQQILEGRTEEQAYIIWSSRYPPQRKWLIWSQAPDEDFAESGYLS
jgi:hypothetical protein